MRGLVSVLALASALAAVVEVRGAPPPCPAAGATLAFHADNRSGEESVELTLSGELLDPAATCAGAGLVAYTATLTCNGSGLVPCGEVPGLRPGTWVHRVRATVGDSDSQTQAQRTVVVAGGANPLVWTLFPRTFVVTEANETDLRAQLSAAAAYTSGTGGAALVTFAAATFPGAASPQTIDLTRGPCTPDPTRHVAICHTGSRVVVDALDAMGERGGVVLSVGARDLSLLRIYGTDNVFRGLVFTGSQSPMPPAQLDTVAVADPGTLRNRIEQCVVDGPTAGDALSVESFAGVGTAADANVIDDCEIRGARDKGIKITTQAVGVVRRSCIHDNQNGGIQATFGGHAVVRESLVQHNVPGPAGNGLSATGNDAAAPSRLDTHGNVVRFAGARGLSVVDHAAARFAHDYVADNQFAGLKVETSDSGPPGLAPQASAQGVALVCNRNAGVSGACGGADGADAVPCIVAADCCGIPGTCCVTEPGCTMPLACQPVGAALGFGASLSAAPGQPAPTVSLGDAVTPGRNALAHNRGGLLGANLHLNLPDAVLAARENQWEHCGDGPLCDPQAVVAGDLRLATGATIELGIAPGPRAGAPVALSVSPARPRRGDLVRVYGDNFDAVNGTACAAAQEPVAPCAADNAPVRLRNQMLDANRIRLLGGDGQPLAVGQDDTTDLLPDAVTPTMLAFRMPVDCFAPLLLEVSKAGTGGPRPAATLALCDAAGCAGQPAGLACDDGNACTVDDRCTGGEDGICAGLARDCTGACSTGACDPASGCEPRPSTAACDDGNSCTIGDHCSGLDDVCTPGTPRTCDRACDAGSCDPAVGCEPRPAATVCRPAAGACDEVEVCDGRPGDCPPDAPAPETRPCDDGNACTVGDHCRGTAHECVPGAARDCVGECLSGTCAPASGCLPAPDGAPCADDGDACTLDLCDATAGCVHEVHSGAEAQLCRIERCGRARLRRRLDRLAASIRGALAAGRTPRERHLVRVGKLLRRCGA